MPAHANELNCKVVSLLSPLLLLPFCSWWWVKHMTKSTRSSRAHGGRCLAAHLPLVVASSSSSAGALPVCLWATLMLGISPAVERPCTYKGRLRPPS